MKIKKELIFSLIGIFLISYFIFVTINENQKNNFSSSQNNRQNYQQNPQDNQKLKQSKTIILTSEEVAKHNSSTDCWLIIDNNVYNVTSYINKHPGGAQALIFFCGKEATQAFETKGNKNKPHSQTAKIVLDKMRIGSLGQEIPIEKIK